MARKPDYGRGHEVFLDYEKRIVNDPAFAGMPDVDNGKGGIQWEAPSNRLSGKFKDTNQRRRDWWRRKAVQIGVDPNASEWLSKTAKAIHPTKKKPCKKCGLVLDIRYAYPSGVLVRRLTHLSIIDESFTIDPLEHISDLIARLAEQFGDEIFEMLGPLLTTGSVVAPELRSLDNWLTWVENDYIPAEPRTLSPGVMSNAPDRLDGFHSFNICCRGNTDTGRTKANLQSYSTDRRVFEYWVEGDWVAADRLMGLIRSDPKLKQELCFNGHAGPCSADHIGPISLGFLHRPEFQLLCKKCNSAKNNRMSYNDVLRLRKAEERGDTVTSWYSASLWQSQRQYVQDDETALRLSKLLRDNRHTYMRILERIFQAGHLSFLVTFLALECADRGVSFSGLRIVDHVTKYDSIDHTTRQTKYVLTQKARRLRVAFAALRDYIEKENRNAYVISTDEIERLIEEALRSLATSGGDIKAMDQSIQRALDDAEHAESSLQVVAAQLPLTPAPNMFVEARGLLVAAMSLVAEELSSMWSDDRYLRAQMEDIVA